uniref:SUZ-C domain-containing protein n=1 Tax=Cyanoderma ruficeps TaxID=181631 RepID=A0A8C3QNW7_9PASS
MADPIPVPVGILRLPRGPDSSGSRGFSLNSRPGENSRGSENSRDSGAVQKARAELRERFLRLLSGARGRPGRFCLWGGIRLRADFGAADVESGTLQTPLGIQRAALLRSGDLLEFSFPLE